MQPKVHAQHYVPGKENKKENQDSISTVVCFPPKKVVTDFGIRCYKMKHTEKHFNVLAMKFFSSSNSVVLPENVSQT